MGIEMAKLCTHSSYPAINKRNTVLKFRNSGTPLFIWIISKLLSSCFTVYAATLLGLSYCH